MNDVKTITHLQGASALNDAGALVQRGENAEDSRCRELTDFIQQIIRRNQDADFLQYLLTTSIALERQFNR